MSLTGNRGEWSEIYALFKLLGEGKVYAGNEQLQRIEALFYPIIKILRNEKEGQLNFERKEQRVVIQTAQGEPLLDLPANDFLQIAQQLFTEITQNNGAFALPSIEHFMHKVHCSSLKARSSDKADIHIVLHDPRTKLNALMGFSIKSQLGHPATLLNASKSTNFVFRVVGTSLSPAEIDRINSIDSRQKILDRISTIEALGGRFEFSHLDAAVFSGNLRMLDGDLPQIMAQLLLCQARTGEGLLANLIDELAQQNPLNYSAEVAGTFYAYKVKHLLISVALGMMPATPWSGRFEANGGYLVVKRDGDVLCYHFYDRNRVEDYLLANAFLERASTSRHDYGYLYHDAEGKLCFKR